MRMRRRSAGSILTLLLVLSFSACSNPSYDDDATTGQPATPSPHPPTPTPAAPASPTPVPAPTPATPTSLPATPTPATFPTPTPGPAPTSTPATFPTSTPATLPTPTPDPAQRDQDGDGFSPAAGDCDDGDAAIHPGADERCDGVDNDCDGTVDEHDAIDASTWYADVDGDGYGSALEAAVACSAPEGYVDDATDCDDGDPAINPGTVWYADQDGDGDGDPETTVTQCGAPAGYVLSPGDCDDGDPQLNSGTVWYVDDDTDGYGTDEEVQVSCDAPAGGGALVAGDCDDADATVHPGATEVCDGIDQDCDGVADAGACDALYFDGGDRVTVPSSSGLDASTALTMEAWFKFTEDPYAWTHSRAYLIDRVYSYRLWYSPTGDGYSIPDQFFCDLWDWMGVYTQHEYWETDTWYHIACVWDGTIATVYVNGIEEDSVTVQRTLNQVANDVTLGYGYEADTGFIGLVDEVRLWNVPRTEEEIRAGVCVPEEDPAGLLARWTSTPTGPQTIEDASGHGHAGTLGTSSAVEDSDPSWSPEAPECDDMEWCDGIDNDGDGLIDDEDAPLVDAGTWYLDADGDGWGDSSTALASCAPVEQRVNRGGDCDDSDPAIHPGMPEIEDGIDNDCDGRVDETGTLHFDGAGDYVYIGDDASVDITGPITMEAWVYAEDPDNDEPILAKEYSSGRQQYWFGVFYGHFGLLIGNGSGWGLNARGSGNVPANTWTHLASVWTGTTWYNYQDGVLVGSGSYTTSPPSTSEPLTIGINSSYDYTAYRGYLSDVRLWNVARSGAQIAGQRCALTDTSGLVGRWFLDDGAGQVAVDASGSGNDGRLGSTADADDRDPTWNDEPPFCRQ